MKKIISLVLVIALCCTISIGLTVAYLTDRDSKANVFTVGDVDIKLDESFVSSELMPGTEINKDVKIENTGANEAWVWYTLAIPQGLEDGLDLTFGTSADWTKLDTVGTYTDANEVNYNVYTYLWNKKLASGEKTELGLDSVTTKSNVDITPAGEWYLIDNGNATSLNWNNSKGNPVIYVSAYGIQAESFADVKTAYEAYQSQWGDNGAEYAEPAAVTEVSDSAGLTAAVAAAGENAIIKLADGEYVTNFKIAGGKNITISGGKNAVLSGQIATTSSNEGTLTISGVTVKVDGSIVDSTGISQTGKSAIAIWGNQTVICEDVTFDMSLADSTAITSWWDTGIGTSIVVRNCTFHCNGQRPIRATGNVTVENTTFDDPYRYAVQLTAKTSTATELDKAIINFNNNTIVNGPSGKTLVYGLQLEGADYGCYDLVINGAGNTITNGGTESAMYYCECGKVDHDTIEWNTEVVAVHES